MVPVGVLQMPLLQNFINDLYKGTKLVLRYDLRLLGATAIHLGLATVHAKLPTWNHEEVRPQLHRHCCNESLQLLCVLSSSENCCAGSDVCLRGDVICRSPRLTGSHGMRWP